MHGLYEGMCPQGYKVLLTRTNAMVCCRVLNSNSAYIEVNLSFMIELQVRFRTTGVGVIKRLLSVFPGLGHGFGIYVGNPFQDFSTLIEITKANICTINGFAFCNLTHFHIYNSSELFTDGHRNYLSRHSNFLNHRSNTPTFEECVVEVFKSELLKNRASLAELLGALTKQPWRMRKIHVPMSLFYIMDLSNCESVILREIRIALKEFNVETPSSSGILATPNSLLSLHGEL